MSGAAILLAALALFLAFPSGSFAQGVWDLTKTPNPTTYTAAGQVINYTYVITNNTPFDGTVLSFTDDKVAVVNCPTNDVPANGTLTCTGSYTIVQADIIAGSVTNTATVEGEFCPEGCEDVTATAQATVTFVAPPSGSITIVKSTTGGDDTFGFTSTVPGAAAFDLTTAGGSASRAFASLAPATYTFTEVNLPTDWDLTSLTCTGDAGGTPTVVNLATRTASVGLDDGESITCTFGNTLADVVPNPIKAFLDHRLSFLADGPDRTRFFRRIPGSLWGDTGGGTTTGSGGPFAFVGSSSDSAMQMSVATSLLDLSQTYAQANGTLDQLPMPSLDVWLEVHYSEFEDEGDGIQSDGRFGVAYVGIDYLVTPTVLVGVLGQIDWAEEDSNAGSSIDGIGGMAGPYLSARLAPNLFFTTRAAYGVSENSVSPIGTYTDNFSTDRWLASAELTGNWNFGNLRITPSASVTYLEEDQHSYTDTRGVLIPDQTVSLGQVSFGPEIAYRFVGDRFTWEPQLSVTGLWDFVDEDGFAAGLVASNDDLRAKVKAGILAQAVGGASLRIVGTFDGIGGGDYDAFGAQAWLSIPLR